MEASLKSACSAFITCAVELVASPLLSWLSKVMKEQTADCRSRTQTYVFILRC